MKQYVQHSPLHVPLRGLAPCLKLQAANLPTVPLYLGGQFMVVKLFKARFGLNLARFGFKIRFLTKFLNDSAWLLLEKLKNHVYIPFFCFLRFYALYTFINNFIIFIKINVF